MGASSIPTCWPQCSKHWLWGPVWGSKSVVWDRFEAYWFDQTSCLKLGLCLFDQRAIWNGSYKELRVFCWCKNDEHQRTQSYLNNRAENSHLPFRRRERAILRFWWTQTLQKFVSAHASIQNHFNQKRHIYLRINFKLNSATALAEWRRFLST